MEKKEAWWRTRATPTDFEWQSKEIADAELSGGQGQRDTPRGEPKLAPGAHLCRIRSE